MKKIEVVAAIIKFEDKILCVQRGESKYDYISRKYEFPGGKIESGETEIESIKREILEELDLEIDVENKFLTVEHDYPDFSIKMHSFLCNCSNKSLKLNEHIDFKWLTINELNKLDWAEADIPIMQKLLETL